MAKVKEIRELAGVILRIKDTTRLANARALIRTVQEAERGAKINARNNFKGTRDRPKTGNLMNSIFSGYVLNSSRNDIAEGFVGVKSKKGRAGTRPYGRIHEYGGTISPVKAKNLWIPLFGPKSTGIKGQFRNFSPSDFVDQMKKKRNPLGRFFIKPSSTGKGKVALFAGKGVRAKVIGLFALRDQVTIPDRPYVRPAIRASMKDHHSRVEQELARFDQDHK